MKRTAPLSEQERHEQQLQLEQEVGRLARQYAIMERDRKAVGEQSGGKLAKQRKVIKILKNEHRNVATNLDVATAPAKIRQDGALARDLEELLGRFDDYDETIATEKRHLREVNDQIGRVKKEVVALEAVQITDVQWQNRALEGRKVVEALENKLDVQIKKFCAIMAENRKLREEIDHLLKERAHFNLLWERLVHNLNQGKKFMLDLIEQATIAYDQREEWCSKLQALRARAKNDLVLHSEEIGKLYGRIDDDEKLREFLSVKCQKRLTTDLENKEMTKRLKQREETETRLREYRETLDEIFEFTGQTVVDELAKAFGKDEEENFALFKYINELNRETEDLSDELNRLHASIDEQRELNAKRSLRQDDKLRRLNAELEIAAREAEEAEAELVSKEATLTALVSGVDRLFKLCRCSNAPLLELLGNNADVDTYNVLLHMEILEKRVSELIVAVYYKEQLETERRRGKFAGVIKTNAVPGAIYTVDKIVATQPCSL